METNPKRHKHIQTGQVWKVTVVPSYLQQTFIKYEGYKAVSQYDIFYKIKGKSVFSGGHWDIEPLVWTEGTPSSYTSWKYTHASSILDNWEYITDNVDNFLKIFEVLYGD